jgi:hypothetical protein
MNKLVEDIGRDMGGKALEHVAVLNIATPSANLSVDSGWYWTNKNDEIINSARALINSNILPGDENFKYGSFAPFNDVSNHKFYESYFHKDWKSREKIDSVFLKQCQKLPFWGKEEEDEEFDLVIYCFGHGTNSVTVELLQKNGNYINIGTYYPFDKNYSYSATNAVDTVKVSNVVFDSQTGVIISKITAIKLDGTFLGPFFSNMPKSIYAHSFYVGYYSYWYSYGICCYEKIYENGYCDESIRIGFTYQLKNPTPIDSTALSQFLCSKNQSFCEYNK